MGLVLFLWPSEKLLQCLLSWFLLFLFFLSFFLLPSFFLLFRGKPRAPLLDSLSQTQLSGLGGANAKNQVSCTGGRNPAPWAMPHCCLTGSLLAGTWSQEFRSNPRDSVVAHVHLNRQADHMPLASPRFLEYYRKTEVLNWGKNRAKTLLKCILRVEFPSHDVRIDAG